MDQHGEFEPSGHGVISGCLRDAHSDMPISGALVIAYDSRRNEVASVKTRSSGMFCFMALSEGYYTLNASVSDKGCCYGVAQEDVFVSTGASNSADPLTPRLVMKLKPNTICGRVRGIEEDGSVVDLPYAQIRINGPGKNAIVDEIAQCDLRGQYSLSGFGLGTRTLIVSANGYEDSVHDVALTNAGQTCTQNFLLLTDTLNTFQLATRSASYGHVALK
ncbi:MAG: hypothetical protein COA42_21775 [Alteromonadaceae bacterium]|nr:MAG: hypothetical protein COA42_21775 [Alteromonadaceae bacterium]